jgi:hypothetical protein
MLVHADAKSCLASCVSLPLIFLGTGVFPLLMIYGLYTTSGNRRRGIRGGCVGLTNLGAA